MLGEIMLFYLVLFRRIKYKSALNNIGCIKTEWYYRDNSEFSKYYLLCQAGYKIYMPKNFQV